MPDESTKNISARIPVTLLNQVLALPQIESQTDAVIQGFTKLLEPQGDANVLQARVTEQDRHIESLQLALERATTDKESLREMYQSHVLQVQTLINSSQKEVKLLEEKLEEETKKKKWWKVF